MTKGKMTAPPLRMGARTATYRPGFNPKRRYRQYLILPHDPLLSENIGKEQGPIMGTETEVTEAEYPTGSGKIHKFHVVGENLFKEILNSSAARGKFSAFERRTPDGPLHPYLTPKQVQDAKDQMVRKFVARARRKGGKTS